MKTDIESEKEVRHARKGVFYKLYTLPWIISLITPLLFFIFALIWVNKLQEKLTETRAVNSELAREIETRYYNTHGISQGKKEIDYAEVLAEGRNLGRIEVQREAIKKGYGEWGVIDNNNLEIIFTWIESEKHTRNNMQDSSDNGSNLDENEKTKVIAGRGAKKGEKGLYRAKKGKDEDIIGGRVREHEFTYVDYEFSKGIGMDLEGDIIKGVLGEMQRVFNEGNWNDIIGLHGMLRVRVQEVIHRKFDGFETYKRID